MAPPFDSTLPDMDPSIAPVEKILETAASRTVDELPIRDGQIVVTDALWLCACETMEDSPVWLIYAVGQDGIGWRRLDDGHEPSDVVKAQRLTGDHPSPEEVLEWLRGAAPAFNMNCPDDFAIYAEIRRRIGRLTECNTCS